MGINKQLYQQKRVTLMHNLFQLAQEKGISHNQIAEKTGFNRSNISRMLSGRYALSIDNLIRLADAVGYDVAVVNKMLNESIPNEHIKPKYMLSIDSINNELYILHRQFPACLIQIKQETPARFIILDLYDEVPNPADILNMQFVEEAKKFYRNYAETLFDQN